MPIAVLVNDKTIIMRIKEVVMNRIAGASQRTVKMIRICRLRATSLGLWAAAVIPSNRGMVKVGAPQATPAPSVKSMTAKRSNLSLRLPESLRIAQFLRLVKNLLCIATSTSLFPNANLTKSIAKAIPAIPDYLI